MGPEQTSPPGHHDPVVSARQDQHRLADRPASGWTHRCDVFELVDGKIKRFDCYLRSALLTTTNVKGEPR